jgi:23S rRNA U2552 (ribose-2'-O)-methylase RlmE/FtsJ
MLKFLIYLRIFYRIFKLKKINKNYNLNIVNKNVNYLTSLQKKFVTDKIQINNKTLEGHNYSHIYYNLFGHFRNDCKLILEVGINKGGSLRLWRKFFKNAKIYGADINPKTFFSEKNIETLYVDQLNRKSIEILMKKINLKNFDIIIDDGLHTPKANFNLFSIAFKYLRDGGIYIIEDVETALLENYNYFFRNFNLEIIILKNNSSHNNNLCIIRK